jgi:hypothetical protein
MSTTTRLGMGTASARFLTIAGLKPRRLEALMRRGKTPDVGALVDREYRGMNLGTAPRLLGIRKFIKGFFLRNRQLYGYNIRARQNDPEQPWAAKLTGGERRRFGFYRVLPVDPESRDNAYLNALLLDYGQGGNGPLDITALLRDYLVRVHPHTDDLLLGKAYIAIGPLRLHVGYFVIERQG